MPNGDNPYIEEYSYDPDYTYGFNQESLSDYFSELFPGQEEDVENWLPIINEWFQGMQPGIVTNWEGWLPEDTISGYGYQGISPEIMQAIGGVFGSPLLQKGIEDWTSQLQANPNILDDVAGQPNVDFWQQIDNSMGGFAGMLHAYGGNVEDLAQFVEVGGVSDYSHPDIYDVNIFDPESLAQTLSEIQFSEDDTPFEYDPDAHIRAAEVKALTPEMIEKTTSAYYDPYESAERGTLVDKLSKQMGKVSTGGFAGSGARTSGLSGAEKLYRGGYEDILGDIMKLRGGATEDVMGTIYGWQDLLQAQGEV